MTLKFSKIGIVIATVATTSPAFAAPQCASLAEANAEQVRILQTELMVAALKCRSREDLGLFQKYNRFVHTYTSELVQHGKTLTGYFQRSYGARYQRKMDTYITSLANAVSKASDKTPGFCDVSSQRADAILSSAGAVTLASFESSESPFATLATCQPNLEAKLEPETATVASSE